MTEETHIPFAMDWTVPDSEGGRWPRPPVSLALSGPTSPRCKGYAHEGVSHGLRHGWGLDPAMGGAVAPPFLGGTKGIMGDLLVPGGCVFQMHAPPCQCMTRMHRARFFSGLGGGNRRKQTQMEEDKTGRRHRRRTRHTEEENDKTNGIGGAIHLGDP